MPDYPYRTVTAFFPTTGKLSTLEIPVAASSYQLNAQQLRLYDITTKEYRLVGLYDGSFTVLDGDGVNCQIDGACLLLLDVADGTFHPVGLVDKSLTTFSDRGQNYRHGLGVFSLLDVVDWNFYQVILDDGTFGIVY